MTDRDSIIRIERRAFTLRLHQNPRDGSQCPVCDRVARIYRRTINAAMAAALVTTAHHFATNPTEASVHVPSLLAERCPKASHGGDYAKLVHWGLLKQLQWVRPDGSNRSGEFSVTAAGFAFAAGELRVPKYVYLLDNEPIDRPDGDDESIDVYDALGKEFNYNELLDWQQQTGDSHG